MIEMMSAPQFWVDVGKIILIDLLLSADNAMVIALACRNLPLEQRKKGVLIGMSGAIGLRVILTFFAVGLLAVPYLRIVGAILLLWIGVKLLIPEDEAGHGNIKGEASLWGAIKTIIIADFVMSLDNVLGVAAVAQGNVWLLIFGLVISIPMIAWGSQFILKLIDRFPIIVPIGGGLLGYVAGEMLVGDITLQPFVATLPHAVHWLFPAACALFVIGLGKWLASRKTAAKVMPLVDEKVPASNNKPTE